MPYNGTAIKGVCVGRHRTGQSRGTWQWTGQGTVMVQEGHGAVFAIEAGNIKTITRFAVQCWFGLVNYHGAVRNILCTGAVSVQNVSEPEIVYGAEICLSADARIRVKSYNKTRLSPDCQDGK